jgi:Zn-dependent protease with chaperone function
MFNNIIYFIVVLLIFSISYSENSLKDPLSYTIGMIGLTWLVFAGYCRWGFQRLLKGEREEGGAGLSGEYQGLVLRLSIMAVFLFALDVYLFHLKYWLQMIPGLRYLSVLQGILALCLFIFYQCTIWHFSHPAYTAAFKTGIRRGPFILSNVKLNVPILFPWVVLSLVYDIISLIPWSGPQNLLNRPEGQIIFFAVFLMVLMVFLPRLIQTWWGCRPFPPSDRVRELKAFLQEKGFRYRGLLRWSIFEGRMMTAGIMGIVPRYRYLLVTDSLMGVLSIEELKAVMAHEMGHARYRHMFFYALFFLGYMVLSFGLFDIFFYFFATQPFFLKALEGGGAESTNLFYFVLSLPILLTLLVYFRYVMGFFMRQFERQADLYSAVVMGSPRETISSLEKIAFLSGKIRNLPSWHHFSIRQRVDYLLRMGGEPGLVRRHNRFVGFSFGIYLIFMIALGYALNFGPAKEHFTYNLAVKILNQQLAEEPGDIRLYENLAMLYHQMEKHREAITVYERIISMDRGRAVALNNLAWILLTAPEEDLRDEERALVLAKEAVAMERSPTFLDTLAEAFYVNGFSDEAIGTIKEALSLARENRGYYQKQLERFAGTVEEE